MLFRSRSNDLSENMICAAYTDAGNRSGPNQDSVYALRRPDFGLFCVADGMGGHTDGDKASAEIANALQAWSANISFPYKGTPNDLFDAVESVVETANRTIYDTYNKKSICGSTLVVLLICRGKFCIVSAGDSRAYRNEDRKLQQITKDDVWQAVGEGAENDRNNGKLLKAVGVSESLICNRISGSIRRKDVFFMCSDGIYKVLGDESIEKLLPSIRHADSDDDLGMILDGIREQVYEKGAPDNNTGIIVKFS